MNALEAPSESPPTSLFRQRIKRFAVLVVCFTLLLAYALSRSESTRTHSLRPIELQGQWICAPGGDSYSAYFRKKVDLSCTVQHAWIVVAAKDGFEVSVNRDPIGRQYLWRPTRPFQNGGSEKGQRLTHQNSALALNFPREYQWDGHHNWLLPTYVEFTTSLRPGENTICVEVESRACPASVNFYGEIILTSGQRISISSDTSWKSEPVPLGPQFYDWTETQYRDWNWQYAELANVGIKTAWRSQPEEIYSQPFSGKWMQSQQGLDVERQSFATNWYLDGVPDEAWLRILANRRYELFINQNRVEVQHRRPPDIDNGDWMLGRDSALDPVARPELLDPDEVSQFFVGKSFQNPRDAQANLEEFRDLKPKTHLPFRNYKTTNRAEDGGEFDPTRTLAESRRTPATPDLPAERPIPNSLKRDRALGGYLAYSIHNLLKPGNNRVEIRPVKEENYNWAPSFAVDGQVTLLDKRQVSIPSAEDWTTETGFGRDPVEIRGAVDPKKTKIPSLTYRGCAKSPRSNGQRFLLEYSRVLYAGIFGVVLLAGFVFVPSRIRSDSSSVRPWKHCASKSVIAAMDTLFAILLAASSVLFCGILVEISFQERHEVLWFLRGTAWNGIFLMASALGLVAGLADILSRCDRRSLRTGVRRLFKTLVRLPETKLWGFLIFWVLLLCVLLRAYKLDLQPLDDDEYASTQAILAILKTGVPSFVPEGIYYTRSPLFHYFTALVAYPFGGNLWSLRLQSVGWSVLTALLTYFCGSRLLKSKWIGFAAMFLLVVHPFEVFTGHVVRFYQMQQFFALLTIYFFCRGFVDDQKQSYRIATLVAFLCAILSQEISAVMGAALVAGYLLFAKDLGWRRNIQLMGISAAVIMVIALDLVAFKTLCLTRTEGVSPVAEASIKLHFWHPQNLFAIFLGYSRLHIIPSSFILLALPLLWKVRNRNMLAFIMFLVVGIVATNLLVSHISLRYQYWLFPVWILVSLYSIRTVIEWIVQIAYGNQKSSVRYQILRLSISLTVVAAILLSWSLWRIPNSYENRLLGDSTGCVRWVRSQMRPGDQLAITEPHTHAGFLESGSIDFDIAVPLLYDFAVQKEGRLVDRNGGAEVLSNVDQLASLFEKHDRVWILLNREKFRTRGKNMRWEYPGARFEVFVRQNCELKHRTYLWNAYLWDSSRGHFVNFRNRQ